MPSIRNDLGGGVADLQWVLDEYTLMFAAMLLTAGSLSDQLGAKRAFASGLSVFVLASVAAVPFDPIGQLTGIAAMGELTFGAIEAGSRGFGDPAVRTAFAVAALALAAFVRSQQTGPHPMLPLQLLRSRTVVITAASGFAFMAGYFGLPFVISLFLQQQRGLSALQTGVMFLPMMLIGLVLTPFSVRLGGPTVSPPATASLLDAVSREQAGVASAVFNTSRQLGGALAVAVFGGLLAEPDTFEAGVHTSLLTAAGVLGLTAVLALFLPPAVSQT